MMKLTTPKKQFNVTQRAENLFYVSSEKTPGENYMVYRVERAVGDLFFCQCNDFFGRRIQHVGHSDFEPCKHGEFVQQTLAALPPGTEIVEVTKQHKKARTITGTVKV